MIASAKQTKTPVCATFELTSRCNLDCKMCYIHSLNAAECLPRELSTEEWKRIFDEAYECGMMFATLTGGECLVRQDFKELYLHLWRKRVFLTVFTNGILMNEDYITFFKTYKPRKVQISLYGSSEAGYQFVTGHTGFAKTVSAIHNLMDAGIAVQVALTPSNYMKDDYISTLRFCQESGFRYKPGEFSLIKNRKDSEKSDHYLTEDEILALSMERATLIGKRIEPIQTLPPCGGGCTEAPKGLICNAGKTSAVVSWDGRMCLCTALDNSAASVLEMSYASAWEKTKELASEVLLGAECVGCAYNDVCPQCPAIRLTDLHGGHCDPRICELTKRLVAVGVKKLPDLT